MVSPGSTKSKSIRYAHQLDPLKGDPHSLGPPPPPPPPGPPRPPPPPADASLEPPVGGSNDGYATLLMAPTGVGAPTISF